VGIHIQASAAPKTDLWARWKTFDPASTRSVDHAQWGLFLDTYLVVNHPSGINRVRYADVNAEDKRLLKNYLGMLQAVEVTKLDRTQQKAYWINLYNALTVKVILDHYPVDSIKDIDISPGWFSFGPWDAKLLQIEGEEVSLNDIEHRILRPIWQDNRIHYAVNCASLGCPNLQPKAFTSDNMEELLEKASGEYINHERGVKLDDGHLTLSSIYKWFQMDFGGSETGVIKHLLKYARTPLANSLEAFDEKVRYEYDWELNGAQ
jgi:hypothetical protein